MMRKIRSRLTIIVLLAVIGTAALSLTLSFLVRNGIILQRDDVMRRLIFGFPLRDVILLVLGIGAGLALVLMASRSTVNPVVELNRATKEIASGNFDITVDIRDRIEEFGELERNFNRMAAELKTNEYLRKDFISNVSHQLRTPLSIVRGYAELLAEGGLSEDEQKEYARYIADEAARLTDLTGDMLRLSRIDNHALQPRRERFCLDEQLRQVILRHEPRAREKGIEIVPALDRADYEGDEELLGQIWDNLLDNAVKFTDEGGCVSVTLRERDGGVSVIFRDTGCGMNEETKRRSFEQFYRGDSSRRGEGNGLGLPLAKRVAELHGGSICLESEEGRGSTFTVTLPKEQRQHGNHSQRT
ncbi:MAG: HAMP domain-containing histidine kinase [Ruminococcaceae bacterium]|nr:HAMP domain-containing histidine kinase [Oscillospiraceae bacterium]